MPEMDGHEAAASIRKIKNKERANVPIIALTADTLLGSEQNCLSSGMDGYLSKPINLESLKQTIDKIVKKM